MANGNQPIAVVAARLGESSFGDAAATKTGGSASDTAQWQEHYQLRTHPKPHASHRVAPHHRSPKEPGPKHGLELSWEPPKAVSEEPLRADTGRWPSGKREYSSTQMQSVPLTACELLGLSLWVGSGSGWAGPYLSVSCWCFFPPWFNGDASHAQLEPLLGC